jgi:hypothetical protein
MLFGNGRGGGKLPDPMGDSGSWGLHLPFLRHFETLQAGCTSLSTLTTPPSASSSRGYKLLVPCSRDDSPSPPTTELHHCQLLWYERRAADSHHQPKQESHSGSQASWYSSASFPVMPNGVTHC